MVGLGRDWNGSQRTICYVEKPQKSTDSRRKKTSLYNNTPRADTIVPYLFPSLVCDVALPPFPIRQGDVLSQPRSD